MKKSLRLLIAIVMVATAVTFITLQGSAQNNNANDQAQQAHATTEAEKFRRSEKPVRNQYIVVLKSETPADEVEPVANEMLAAHGGTVRHVYQHAIKGFSIQLPEPAAMALSRNPRVEYVQEDSEVFLANVQATPNLWNLDRIDQHNLPRNNYYYFPNVEDGAGVNAYVIDTGLKVGHREFSTNGNNRATADADLVWWDNRFGDDCNGHGTSVASVLGGNTFGAAKAVRLHGVRVFDCEGGGDESTVLAGVDWVTANHVKPAVVNMSLRYWVHTTLGTPLEEGIRASIAQGITYVVAAGSDAMDVQDVTPARLPEVITVSATNTNDVLAELANFGSGVDLFAPGVNILTASNVDRNGDGILNDTADPQNGTSFAAPLVAGVVARFLRAVPNASPAAVQGAVVNTATQNVLGPLGPGSPNRLLFADLRHAFLGQQITSVAESAFSVDSGVNLGPGQWLAMTGTGEIWSGPPFMSTNGPQGSNVTVTGSPLPLPGARPNALIGRLDGGELFYIGNSNALVQSVPASTRLFLRTNDSIPGNGVGAFSCKTELWKILPEARSLFMQQTVPSTMVPGQTASATIMMRNLSPTTWTAGQGFKLSVEGSGTTWGRNQVVLPYDVPPEGLVEFVFDFTAPVVPGTYNFQWRMLQEGVQRFGDVTTNVPITVLAPSNQAEFVSQNVPTKMYATESYSVSITMKNVGNTIWPAGSAYRLGSQNPQDNTTWGMNRVVLWQNVYPNQQVTFTFEVMAPLSIGKKNFQWRMVQDGVEWFGATTPNVQVSVTQHPCPGC